MKTKGKLNKKVASYSYMNRNFEIDQLLDTKNPVIYHLFYMDGSKTGNHIGHDFRSVGEAKQFIRDLLKK